MKLLVQCPLCRFSWNRKSEEEKKKNLFGGGIAYLIVSNPDDNILTIDCNRMHISVVYFTNKKFDLLFESGLNAINDLYFREAVATLASALERFYEYSIKIMINDLNPNLVQDSWKNIANQSERQLGAFIFLYLREFKKSPLLLPNKMTEFRNKVIHKGYFPNRLETIEFSEAILEIINENYLTLNAFKNKDIQDYEIILKKEFRNLANAKIEIEKKYFKDKNTWQVVPRPFSRDIPTFLTEMGNFRVRHKNELEKYISEHKNRTVD